MEQKRISYCPYCGYQGNVDLSDGRYVCIGCSRKYAVSLLADWDAGYEGEQWYSVEGYQGFYEVSNYLRVRSLTHETGDGKRKVGKVLSVYRKKRALYVSLYKDGRHKERNVLDLYQRSVLENRL